MINEDGAQPRHELRPCSCARDRNRPTRQARYDLGEPLLIHTKPNEIPDRRFGVCTILIPAQGARLTRNGTQATGQPWPRERETRPFSTCALAFSESWTESR